jgi:hypothetical protein
MSLPPAPLQPINTVLNLYLCGFAGEDKYSPINCKNQPRTMAETMSGKEFSDFAKKVRYDSK